MIRWPVSSAPGPKGQESAGRLVNVTVEKVDDPDFPLRYYRAPGLLELVDVLSHSHCRGMIDVDGTLIAVFDGRAYTVTEGAGTFPFTNQGAFAGTGMLTIAKNSAATPNIVAVDVSEGAKNLFTSGAPTAFADADLPANPKSVHNHNNYFMFPFGDGRIFSTGLNAVTVASNAFTTFQGDPDGLLRGIEYGGLSIFFGHKASGVYRDVGASPFPLELVATIPVGIAGTFAVAGHELGWGGKPKWVTNNNQVVRLDGYTPATISTPAVERAIATCADKSALRANVTGANGHSYWNLTSPGEWTWTYDNRHGGTWQERKSYGRDDWRGSASVKAFDRWIVGDETTGKLGEFTDTHYREFGDPLVFQAQSLTTSNFPANAIVPRADFNFTAGTGVASGEDPIQTAPVALIEWSNNGGATFGNPVSRELGAQGQYGRTVPVQRTGMVRGKGRVYRVSVSDPVHVCMKAAAQAEVKLKAA